MRLFTDSVGLSSWFEMNRHRVFLVRGGLIADYHRPKKSKRRGCLCVCVHGKRWNEGGKYEKFYGKACEQCSEKASKLFNKNWSPNGEIILA